MDMATRRYGNMQSGLGTDNRQQVRSMRETASSLVGTDPVTREAEL